MTTDVTMEVSSETNRWNETVTIIKLPEGRLIATNGNEIRQQLYQLLKEHPSHIVLDMGAISFIDSVGVAVLLSVSRRAGANRRLKLCSMQEQAKMTFDLLDFGKVFSLHDSVERAVADCQPMEEETSSEKAS